MLTSYQDVTTRGSYYPNKNMATAAVSHAHCLSSAPKLLLRPLKNLPLYLHITSTTKEGLEAAVAKVQELIQQELPQLVDERRFRRREQEQLPPVERDEFGRVGSRSPRHPSPGRLSARGLTMIFSASGPRRRCPSAWSQFRDLTSVPRLLGQAVHT